MKNPSKYVLKAGNINNLQIESFTPGELAPDQVRIRVEAIGLNFADIFAIWGLYSATPKGRFTPGLEYAGRIESVGAKVKGLHPGDRVMGVTRFGAYTTLLDIDARYVIPVPQDWSIEQGAAYLVQVLTAYYGLYRLGQIQAGYTVLIHSAAGGVGIFANRLAKAIGAYTIGTVGGSQKVDFCLKEGYDDVIVRDDKFAKKLNQTLGDRSLNLVMECIGGKIFEAGFKALAPQGRSIIYGAARYAHRNDRPNYLKLLWKHLLRPKVDPQSLAEINKGLLGFNLIYLYEQADLMHTLLKEIEDLHIGKPYIGQTFSFDQLPEAIRTFQGGKTIGKVVVLV